MKLLFALLLSILFACNSKKADQQTAQTKEFDPDIVLINIGNTDRVGIATLLAKVSKCNPILIGLDIVFFKEKKEEEDSVLESVLKIVNNDILAYAFDMEGKEERPIPKFRKQVSGEGYVNTDEIEGVISHFTPIKEINGNFYESFALTIVKHWKPDLPQDKLVANKSIPILFRRTLDQYYHFTAKDLLQPEVCERLNNKIVILGFLGPGEEDKHLIPSVNNDSPSKGIKDTYGPVIIANTIRTLLEQP